jgi:hypothetical protein
MKLFCCKDEAYCYLGALFLVAVLLTACAGDNNGNAIGPDAQNEISSSSLSSGAEPGELSLDASSIAKRLLFGQFMALLKERLLSMVPLFS